VTAFHTIVASEQFLLQIQPLVVPQALTGQHCVDSFYVVECWGGVNHGQ
jgi:hypothetical protein